MDLWNFISSFVRELAAITAAMAFSLWLDGRFRGRLDALKAQNAIQTKRLEDDRDRQIREMRAERLRELNEIRAEHTHELAESRAEIQQLRAELSLVVGLLTQQTPALGASISQDMNVAKLLADLFSAEEIDLLATELGLQTAITGDSLAARAASLVEIARQHNLSFRLRQLVQRERPNAFAS